MRDLIIFDTTLRDGEQSPGASLRVDDKLIITRHLLNLGLDVIEAGFPASSLDDSIAVSRIAQMVGDNAVVCALSRAVRSDIEAAARALTDSKRPRIHTGIGVSELHLDKKLKLSHEACLERITDCVAYARTYVDDVQFYAEDAGRADRAFLKQALEAAIAAGASTLCIPDTTGYNLPNDYADLIRFVKENVIGIDQVKISVHCHNDLGMATALSLAGVAAGAEQVECTINGIGERAGNAALEEIVMAVALHGDELGVSTNINASGLIKASRSVAMLTGIYVPANKAVVGANAFAHSSGIHQDGVLKDAMTYEIFTPESVGAQSSQIVLTARSGHSALKDRLSLLGWDFSPAELDEIYEAFLLMADKKKEVYDEDLESLINERERLLNATYTIKRVQISTGFPLTPTATVTLQKNDEEEQTACEFGTGPIDAAYKAIDKIVGMEVDLKDFSVKSITRGIDALGEVTVSIKSASGKLTIGRGSDGDIVVSAVKAYVDALNRVIGSE